MRKIALLVLFISVPITILSMKKHPVETGNNQITCKVQTYTQHQMMLLIGSMFFPTHIMHREDSFFEDQVKIYYTEHPMDTLPENYMATKVFIKNNSDEPMYLTGNYLLGTQDFFVSKQKFLKDHLNKHLNCKSEKIGAMALFTAPLLLSLLIEIALLPKIPVTRSNYTAIQVLRCILHGISGTFSLNGYFWLKNINLLNTIHSKILSKTFHKIENDNFYNYYKSQHQCYEIPPKATFQDIFFVPLKDDVERNIFEKINIKLHYSTKPPEQKT